MEFCLLFVGLSAAGCGSRSVPADAAGPPPDAPDAPDAPDPCVAFEPLGCGQSGELFAGQPYRHMTSVEVSGFSNELVLTLRGADPDAPICSAPSMVVHIPVVGEVSWPLDFGGTQPVSAVIYGQPDILGEVTIDAYERATAELSDGTYGTLRGSLRLDFAGGSRTATLSLPICGSVTTL